LKISDTLQKPYTKTREQKTKSERKPGKKNMRETETTGQKSYLNIWAWPKKLADGCAARRHIGRPNSRPNCYLLPVFYPTGLEHVRLRKPIWAHPAQY
jgi:hypothetical protein